MATKKIATTTTVKSVTKKPKDCKVSFDDMDFSDGQIKQLEGYMAENRELRITIEPTEQLLTDED